MGRNAVVRYPVLPSSLGCAVVFFALSFAFAAAFAAAQPFTPSTVTPVGRWITEHPGKNNIASWWDFRPDGTLTMYIGAAVTAPITRSGDTFIAPAVSSTDPPVKVTYRIEGDTLHLTSSAVADQMLLRVGPAVSAKDPLLGRWKPVPPVTQSADPAVAAQMLALSNSIFIFSADNTETVRAPFTSVDGKWDAGKHTFHLQSQTVTYTFQREGARLILTEPPDGKHTDTYVVDPLF